MAIRYKEDKSAEMSHGGPDEEGGANARPWQNPWWAVAFLSSFITYLCLAGWMLYEVQQNSESYLKIDKALLPKSMQNLKVKEGETGPAGGLAVEQPAPVDL